MNDIPKEKVQAFLDDLTKLSREYRLQIGGCGCCGSPWIINIKGGKDAYRYFVDYGLERLEWKSTAEGHSDKGGD